MAGWSVGLSPGSRPGLVWVPSFRVHSRPVIDVRFIKPDHPLYEQECTLREDVLLRNVGYDMDRFRADYPVEDKAEHAVAVVNHPTGDLVIGCALLIPGYPDDGVGKVVQVAVHPQRQREGVGRRLMATIEGRAFGELGLVELFCHAQLTAVPFYEGLGWSVNSDEFMEAGIPHRRMVIRADAPNTI